MLIYDNDSRWDGYANPVPRLAALPSYASPVSRASVKSVQILRGSRQLPLPRFVLSPPSLDRFVTQGLLPVWWCWDVASLVLMWGLRILID